MAEPWNDTTWIMEGTAVIYTARPHGVRHIGVDRPDGSTAWLIGGARGRVIEGPSGGYPPSRCPNHRDYPDCLCGDESGRVPGRRTSALVAWTMSDGLVREELIYADGRGRMWTEAEHG